MGSTQKKDVLYLKRTPTVTYDSTSGAPIPEAIKKFYVQQQLPVRKQSLAANRLDHRRRLNPSFLPPKRISSIPFPIATNNDVIIQVEAATPTSPQQQQQQQQQHDNLVNEVEQLEIGNTFIIHKEELEEDEFNFIGRPPSSIISIQPFDPDDDEESDRDEDAISKIDNDLDDLTNTWDETPSIDTSPDLIRRKDSEGEQDQSTEIQHDSRISLDTIFSNSSELTLTPNQNNCATNSYSSVFLTKMQEKREEQIKSINAYRSQHNLPKTIYIALLSDVAREFYKKMTVSTMSKDGIEHHDVFSGKDAVDCLVSILQVSDRSEAAEVGCALRNQNFFHDVNYEPFLVDSPDELYAYKDMMGTPKDDEILDDDSRDSSSISSSDLPNGIYTDLTDCYSPTCTKDNLCYSLSCPRKKSFKQSQTQNKVQKNKEESRLWLQSVPEAIVAATMPKERKRQECIYELIYTEEDFVRDLQYCQDFWIKPLLSNDIIGENKQEFVQDVFYNIMDIYKVNSELSKTLKKRQSERYLVSSIGDIMLEHVKKFQPFVEYGSHQIIGKFTFEIEKKRNPLFAKFVEETERKPESRRLELNGYLTKPTTRLGRYNLLLREILKRTPDDNPDKKLIPKVMDIITQYLQQVNIEAGKCENLFNLLQIQERLEFRSAADYVDLKLDQPGRQLLMKGRMKRKGNTSSEASDLQVFLFDHYLVFAKIKFEDHIEKYKTFRRPIPLELLSVSTSSSSNRHKRASSILPYNLSANLSMTSVVPKPSTSETASSSKPGNSSINFTHHGRKGSSQITLFTSSPSVQQIWVQKIMDQKALLSEKHAVFSVLPLVKNHFTVVNKVNNTTHFDGDDKRLIIGTDHGVYMCEIDPYTQKTNVTKIINIEKVTQIEVMSDSQLLVLADKCLWAYPLEIFSEDVSNQAKRGKLVYQNASFIHMGECLSKKLVCVVKSNTLSGTTIRVLESVIMDDNKKSRSKFSIKRLVRSGPAGLKAYKDLYSPSEATSISLLKTQMCITSPKEIGVVDMKSFGVQALLDPEDEALSFVFGRPDVRPITLYKIDFAKFLVCYNEFAFCVDQKGRFIQPSARIDWEGEPDSFALLYPYVLAFEPDFIEIRNIETGELEQIIRGKNIRCTNNDTHNQTIQCAMDDLENEGYQVVFQLEKNK